MYEARIYRSGTQKIRVIAHSSGTGDVSIHVSDILYLTADQYIELFAYHNAGVNTVDIVGDDKYTFLSIYYLGY